MALSQCEACTTLFAVGLTVCPHCGSDRYGELGAVRAVPDLSKMTKAQLIEEAERRGVDLAGAKTNAERRARLDV